MSAKSKFEIVQEGNQTKIYRIDWPHNDKYGEDYKEVHQIYPCNTN